VWWILFNLAFETLWWILLNITLEKVWSILMKSCSIDRVVDFVEPNFSESLADFV
jgi:Ca2+-dependent lipid-binding protein